MRFLIDDLINEMLGTKMCGLHTASLAEVCGGTRAPGVPYDGTAYVEEKLWKSRPWTVNGASAEEDALHSGSNNFIV